MILRFILDSTDSAVKGLEINDFPYIEVIDNVVYAFKRATLYFRRR